MCSRKRSFHSSKRWLKSDSLYHPENSMVENKFALKIYIYSIKWYIHSFRSEFILLGDDLIPKRENFILKGDDYNPIWDNFIILCENSILRR